MNITLRQLTECENSLIQIGEVEGVSGVVKCRVSRILSQTKPILVDFHKARKQSFEKFAKKGSDGSPGTMSTGSEEYKKFELDLEKLLDESFTIEVNKISMERLLEGHINVQSVDKDGVTKFERHEITPRHLADLNWMIDMDFKDEPETEGEAEPKDKNPRDSK